MKKVIEFIKKYWFIFLAFLGLGALLTIKIDPFASKPDKPLIPDIDVKKEHDIIDKDTEKEKERIDWEAKEALARSDAKTPEEAIAGLSPKAQEDIQKVKDEAVKDIVNGVLGRLG
jgi:hypothetical protein